MTFLRPAIFLAAALALTGTGAALCLFTLRGSRPRGRSSQPLEAVEASPSV
ncbi:MAG: hypothetical protein JNM70_24245 [Anaerolineae bacterium]|nr:hypothetical protein [Anaerolineae bacterium]